MRRFVSLRLTKEGNRRTAWKNWGFARENWRIASFPGYNCSSPVWKADVILTVPQCAERLGVSQGAVRVAIYEGRLPAIEMYGKRLVMAASLETYRQRSQPSGEKRVGRPPKNAA